MPSKVTKTTKTTIAKSSKKTDNVKKNETKPAQNTEVKASNEKTIVQTSTPLQEQIKSIQCELGALTSQIRELSKKLTAVDKRYAKERKQMERLQKKKKSPGGSGMKHQSGIAKPGFISPELCDFLGVSKGTEMARTEVIKYVNKYIKEQKLQDQNNKKVIVPDAKLQTLLQSNSTDEITYFNLQTYMKPHYANPAKQTSTVA